MSSSAAKASGSRNPANWPDHRSSRSVGFPDHRQRADRRLPHQSVLLEDRSQPSGGRHRRDRFLSRHRHGGGGVFRRHGRIRLSDGTPGSVAAGISRPDSPARPGGPCFCKLVLSVVPAGCRMVAGAFHCAETDPSCTLDTGCFCVVEPADKRRVRFVGASRIAFVVGLEPTTRSSLVEGDLPVTPRHRSCLGSGLPLQAVCPSWCPQLGCHSQPRLFDLKVGGPT